MGSVVLALPHRSYARVTALEERGEPGDAALHGLLVDRVGAFETRERIRVAGVLDLHREDRTVGRALVASDLPGEGAGSGRPATTSTMSSMGPGVFP